MTKSNMYSTESIIQALHATNGLVSLAAKKLGCERQTIYNRAKTVQIVQRAIEESRGELVDLAEMGLRTAVINKEPWAIALTLRTIGKERGYVERQETEYREPITLRIVRDNDLK